MNIVVAANSKYKRYLYVMLLSLFKNNADEKISVYVMQRDFSEQDKQDILDLADQYHQAVFFVFVDQNRFDRLPVSEKFTLETYFRLIMSQLLPSDIKKVLYLDVDIIIRGSIRDLYDTDITEYVAAVCLDVDNPVLIEKKRELFHRSDDMRYFNAGVMLWNMERLRASYRFDDFLRAAEELGYELQFADQEILNYLLYDKVVYCSHKKYNYITRRDERISDLADDEAIVLHYAGCNPWQNGQKNELYRIWWDYAKETPFYIELLEENLWREIGFFDERNYEWLRDMELKEIYECAFNLKGSGRIANSIRKSQQKLGVYGAGTMAEVLYGLLVSDGCWKEVRCIADAKKKGTFHGVNISNSLVDEGETIWIVTPVYRSKDLVNHIKSSIRTESRAISLRDWLKNIA